MDNIKESLAEATTPMSTAAEIASCLRVLGSRMTYLGLKASVAMYLGDEEVFCDEVKLWKATSRENFSKRCLKILGLTAKTEKGEQVRAYIDEWLRSKNFNY